MIEYKGLVGAVVDIPADVQAKIDTTLDRAGDTPTQNNSMTDEEATTEIKSQCAEENIEDHDPDSVLEETLTSGGPGEVVIQSVDNLRRTIMDVRLANFGTLEPLMAKSSV